MNMSVFRAIGAQKMIYYQSFTNLRSRTLIKCFRSITISCFALMSQFSCKVTQVQLTTNSLLYSLSTVINLSVNAMNFSKIVPI